MGELFIKKVRRKYLHAVFCGNGPQPLYFRLIHYWRRQERVWRYGLPDFQKEIIQPGRRDHAYQMGHPVRLILKGMGTSPFWNINRGAGFRDMNTQFSLEFDLSLLHIKNLMDKRMDMGPGTSPGRHHH